jgi:hypothetical protein
MLALTEQTRNHFTLGENNLCMKCLDSVQMALENDVNGNDIAAEINYFGYKALMMLKTDDLMNCWQEAEEAFHSIEKMEPTCYYTFSGLGALVEVYIHLSQHPAFSLRISKAKIQTR